MIRLVAFDLDGTLVHGDTVVETLAKAMGHLEHARALERRHDARRDRESLRVLREELAQYYAGASLAEICAHLPRLILAPGVREGFAMLRAAGIASAIATFTWEFAAAWLGRELGAEHWLGTRLHDDGHLEHVWEEDKGTWLVALTKRLGLERDHVAAVGDSWRDLPMLEAAGRSYYVGSTLPPGVEAVHVPSGDIAAIARQIVQIP